METDRELKKTFRVFFDQEDVLNIILLEDPAEATASNRQSELIREAVLDALKKSKREKNNFLMDLSIVTDIHPSVPAESREVFVRLLREVKVNKVAVVGGGIVMSVVAKFISIAARKRKELKWFKNEEEARKWFKE